MSNFLGIPNFVINSALLFIENLQGLTEPTGWGHGDTSNQNWLVSLEVPYSNVSVTWGNTVPACPACMHRSPVNTLAAARRVHDDLLCRRRRECMRSPTKSFNRVVNPKIHRRGDDRGCPVTQ